MDQATIEIEDGTESDKEYIQKFSSGSDNDYSMRNYISTLILNKIKCSKKREADLSKAKDGLSSMIRLSNGIMTNAGLEVPCVSMIW